MQEDTLNLINEHIKHAREKHPFFASDLASVICLAVEELGEMAQAHNDGDIDRMYEEAADLIAVLIRLLEGD